MPAAKQAAYNKLIGDLSSTGEEGVLMLVNMINAPGKGSNANVDYALSGLTHYVMAKGEENARLVTAKAYLKALLCNAFIACVKLIRSNQNIA